MPSFIVLVFLIIFIRIMPSHAWQMANISKSDEIDSLFLSADEHQIKAFISNHSSLGNDYSSVYELLDRIEKRRNQSVETNKEAYDYYNTLDGNFSELRAGIFSKKLFLKFKQSYLGGDYNRCAFFLQTALFFRKRYIEKEKERIINNYNEADILLKNGDFDETHKKIEKFRQENKLNPGFLAVRDSLNALFDTLENELDLAERRERAANKPLINKTLQFDFEYAGNKPLSGENVSWKFVRLNSLSHKPEYLSAKFDQIKSLPDFDMSYNFQWLVMRAMAVRVGYQKGRYTYYEPPHDLTQWGMSKQKYHVDFDRLAYGVSYYISEKFGIRPYLGFMFGVLNLKTKMMETLYDGGFKVDAKNEKTPSYMFMIGADYIDENHPIVFGIRFVYSYSKKDLLYLNSHIFSVKLLLGIAV